MAKLILKEHITHVHLPETSTVQDFITAMSQLFSDKHYRQNPCSIWHIHETDLNVSPTDLKRIKDFVLTNRGNIDRGVAAVIVNSKEQKGILLIYELITYKLPVDMQIFMTLDEALEWIKSRLK